MGVLGEPGWRPGEHIMWCKDWDLRTFTFMKFDVISLKFASYLADKHV